MASRPPGSRARRHARAVVRSLLAAAVAGGVLACAGAAVADPPPPDFGPNVTIIDPSMSTADIQAKLDAISAAQISNQFGDRRDAVLFMPGTYGTSTEPLNFQVGYYTEVAGLGASPGDVTLNGTADVFNQCFAPNDCTALVNFWRSLSNMTINVAGKTGCPGAGEFWAVSQAAPMRRVDVNGFMTLMDFCSNPAFASGGFIADSRFSSTIVNGSQQQWLVRNSSMTPTSWTNGVWNQVFAGVDGAPPQSFPTPNPYTTLPTNPASRERPFLYTDTPGHYAVYVPAAQTDSSGPTWTSGQTPGRSIPIERFFIARPTDTIARIDQALNRGKDLIFTPGVYHVDQTIKVKRRDAVVLGLGFATLEAENGVIPMTVADVPGVDIAGLLFDAGPVKSPVLLRIGSGNASGTADPSDPTALQDVFFRIGGAHLGKAKVSLKVNSDDVILDDIWAWRADHGDGVGWNLNTADNGVIVNGDNVTATGLFVEHYQQYEVIWNGENGKTIFFQNEMPYDPPTQDAWRRGALGYAAYKVADTVQTHEGWGLGSYCFFNVNPSIHAEHAFEVPVTPGVRLHDILTLSITGHGVIDHVVNDVGPPTPPDTTPVDIVSYP